MLVSCINAYKQAKKLADGSMKTNNNTVGTLLTEYINAGGDTAFLSTPSPEMEAQARAGAEGSDSISIIDPAITPLDDSTITQMKQQRVAGSIQANVQASPQAMKTALTDGMTALTNIETRIQRDSGNINHQGINIEAIHDTYISYVQGEIGIETAAPAMAESIKTVMGTQTLTEAETAGLTNVLAESIFEIVDAVTGEVIQTYEFNLDIKQWILKGGK